MRFGLLHFQEVTLESVKLAHVGENGGQADGAGCCAGQSHIDSGPSGFAEGLPVEDRGLDSLRTDNGRAEGIDGENPPGVLDVDLGPVAIRAEGFKQRGVNFERFRRTGQIHLLCLLEEQNEVLLPCTGNSSLAGGLSKRVRKAAKSDANANW